jgi:hypothetical protein
MTPDQSKTLNKLDQKVDDLICVVEKGFTQNGKVHDSLDKKITSMNTAYTKQSDVYNQRFISTSLFKWIIAFIIIGIIGVAGMSADNRSDISKVGTQISHHLDAK